MSRLQWFRMYSEAVDDEKLRLLAFEDRWHFVALLCCKAQGILDEDGELRNRKVAVKLGLSVRELEEVARRLSEVDLIDAQTLQPLAWDHRQFKSDSSLERVRAFRERMKRGCNVTVTAQETETETETEQKKNKRVRAFNPPSVEEIKTYCHERRNSVDPERFHAYYESNGWMVGRNRMKNWKAAVRTWEANSPKQEQQRKPKEFPRAAR